MFRRVVPALKVLLFLSFPVFTPLYVLAQASFTPVLPSVATAIPVLGNSVAYGDIIDFDDARGVYVLSQFADDSHVYGVVVKDPPLLYVSGSSTVPVAKDGVVLVNVTLENGAIAIGDDIITSSIPGKGMRASATSTNPIGTALEMFDGTSATTSEIAFGLSTLKAGTIAVSLDANKRHVIQTSITKEIPASGQICLWQCVPFGTLMRYLTAALVSFGSVYLAFRTFMADAVNGVLSIGRNPLAKASIQSMVVFNAVLSVVLAVAGLIAGIVILFIQL